MQEYIDGIPDIDAFLGGSQCSYQHACFASAVRHVTENIDNLHIAKSKCYVRFTSAWSMENMHVARKVSAVTRLFSFHLQAVFMPAIWSFSLPD